MSRFLVFGIDVFCLALPGDCVIRRQLVVVACDQERGGAPAQIGLLLPEQALMVCITIIYVNSIRERVEKVGVGEGNVCFPFGQKKAHCCSFAMSFLP